MTILYIIICVIAYIGIGGLSGSYAFYKYSDGCEEGPFILIGTFWPIAICIAPIVIFVGKAINLGKILAERSDKSDIPKAEVVNTEKEADVDRREHFDYQ